MGEDLINGCHGELTEELAQIDSFPAPARLHHTRALQPRPLFGANANHEGLSGTLAVLAHASYLWRLDR